MKKEFFELVKKGFAAQADAATLYFTKDGKAFTDEQAAAKAAKVNKAGKDQPENIVDEGYTIVNRSQLEPLEKAFAEANQK